MQAYLRDIVRCVLVMLLAVSSAHAQPVIDVYLSSS